MPNGRGGFARGLPRGGMVVGAIAVVILAGGGATAWAFSSGGTTPYVTAAVTTGQATQTLQETGTIEPATEAAVAFQVGGQVSAVSATVGQKVAAGQVLAKLDTTSLNASLAGAQAAVSADQARLDNDEASQTAALAAAATATPTTPSPSSAANSQLASKVSAAQKNVASAQHQTDLDTKTAQQDLAQASTACGAPGGTAHVPGGGGSTGSTTTAPGSAPTTGGRRPGGSFTGPPSAGAASVTTTTSTTTTTTTSTTTSTSTTSSTTSTTTLPPTTTPPPSTSTACTSALQSALGAEQLVTKDQQAVSTAEQGLAADLTHSGAGGGGSGGSSGAGGAGLSGAGASGGGAHPGGASPAAVASPQQIAADQASLDAATEQLTIEQQAVNDAQLASPIAGTVAAVAISAGQSVSAGSSSEVITVVNPSAFDVVTNVAVTDLSELKIGDPAQVTPAGTSQPLEGKVTSVSVVGASSGSTATLPVTISLPSGAPGLFSGATASVAIIVGQVGDTTVVPTSAVHTIGARHIVDVLSGNKEQPTLVTVGAVGPLSTQITKGLHLGQRVVLADPSLALPSSTGLTGPGLARLAGFGGGGGFARFGPGGPGGAGRPGG